MKHKSFRDSICPIARSLERVGEWWSILILREAFYGAKRFDEFQSGLEGIAPNTLTKRLKELVDAGLFERRQYSSRPERYEYVLTDCGRDFLPVLWTMLEWGNKHFCSDGNAVHIANVVTNERAIPYLVDRSTGMELLPKDYRMVAGSTATEGLKNKIAKAQLRSQ